MATTSGVQTVERALGLLETIADAGESITVTALADAAGLPLPTTYRLLRSMMALGYVRQLPSRQYGLGPRLIRLGESAGRALNATARSYLLELVERTEETANLAMLDGDMVVYIAQAPSKHSMRMFTEIGRRVLPHATGVGKALLAQMDDDAVAALVARTGMPARTDKTITTLPALLADLELIRERGWAEDNGEQEVGVRCLAAAIPGSGSLTAISVSGPEARITSAATERIAPMVASVAHEMRAMFEAEPA
jgi:IclR family transcriptional regulator, acetate operon repressor